MKLTGDARYLPQERLARCQVRPRNADRMLQILQNGILAAKTPIWRAIVTLALYKVAHICTLLPWPEKDALRPTVLCSVYDQVETAQLPCILDQVRHCIVNLVCLRSQHTTMRGDST